MQNKILVIDDDENLLKSLKKILRLNNYFVNTIQNPSHVVQQLENHVYNCILMDVKMPELNGLDLLKVINKKCPTTPIIMISGQSNIQIAVEALKNGAYDFIEKPLAPDRILIMVKNVIYQQDLQEEKNTIFAQLQKQFRMIGRSAALQKIFHRIQQVANTNAKVLITGESGTGKELVAWAIHHNSQRKGKPYIKINCAAIPLQLLESELFGHKRGSFTGATSDRKGKFIAADNGTLFLDEIGDMYINLQVKLLRVLDQNEIEIIGENFPKKVDVRIIAATNQNLEQLVEKRKFREDLYYRLNVVNIFIPPLREREEDILPLAYYFLRQFNEQHNKQILTISRQAQSVLLNYQWPGNIRELRNVIEKLVVLVEKKEIGIEDVYRVLKTGLFSQIRQADITNDKIKTLKNATAGFEKKYILFALNQFKWKIGDTAQALGIDRSNLFKKMRKLGIEKKLHKLT